MIYENIEVLEHRFPHVSKVINKDDVSVDEASLLSEESFNRDETWLQAVSEIIGNSRVVFVYGFGLGLGIADLLEVYPDRWFFVYEPNEELFAQVVQTLDLSTILSQPNLYWLTVGDKQLPKMFEMLSSYMQEQLVFVALRKYLFSEMDVLREVKQKFKDYNRLFSNNKFTENRFRREWTQNYLYHLRDIVSTPSIEQLFMKYQGATAIVVSSGPSLNDDIEWIKKLRPHVLIIAAGSSVQALVKHGIKPHLCVIMDGHPVNKEIYSSDETLLPPLLFTTSSYYEIADRKSNHKIHSIMKSDQISQFLLGYRPNQLFIFPTATVAGTAIQAAVCLGASRVVLAGQDLSFPDNELYSAGVDHFTTETQKEISNRASKQILNVNGGYNLTDEAFLSMKSSLENLISVLSNIEFINTSRRGAAIEGAPFRPIEELFESVSNNEIEEDAIAVVLDQAQDQLVNEVLTKQLVTKLSAINVEVLQANDKAGNLLRLLSQFQEFSRTKPAKAMGVYEKIETMWASIANQDWFAPLLETIIPIEIATFDQELPRIVNEETLTRKADLLREHLGKLLTHIQSNIPVVSGYLDESITRLRLLVKTDSTTGKA